MTWDSQIGNLLSGFVGAVVGVIGLLYVQHRTQAEARRAAGRAVLAEMFTNADRALSAKSTLVLHEFTDFAWQQQMPLVAQLLNWVDLKTLVNTYDSAARAFENAREVIHEGEQQVMDQSGKVRDLGRIGSWFRDVAQEWIVAMRILQRTVLTGNECRQLDEDIKKLETRIG
jgi:hypothetical protein